MPPTGFQLSTLARLSQPAHLVTFVTSSYLAFLLFPGQQRKTQEPSTLVSLLYVGAFATHFGTQLWMTFVSGLVLFFTLPRHTFGMVQKQLFPKYFLLNSFLSFVTLVVFALHAPSEEDYNGLNWQTWSLVLCFLTELTTRLYVVPDLLVALEERMVLEKEAGVGMEIGWHDQGRLVNCPHYQKVNRRFRTLHGFCALANIFAMGFNAIHVYYVAVRFRSVLT